MDGDLKPLPQNRLVRGVYLMVQRYLRHNVAIQSASLAFYLLFMIFPFLIFISSLLGLLHLDVAGILTGLSTILPKTVVELVEVYLNYVEKASDLRILLFGLFFSIYFPMFIVLFIVVQQIDGNLIYPRVVGSSVGLPPIWVLVAVIVGGKLFGVAGILFFIPFCSVLYTLTREFIRQRLEKKEIPTEKLE